MASWCTTLHHSATTAFKTTTIKLCINLLGPSLFVRVRVHMCRTLALMMVGRGSRMPCIFLRAGITNRLHVTTADTGLPGSRKHTVSHYRATHTHNNSMCNAGLRFGWRQTCYSNYSNACLCVDRSQIPGRAKMSFRAPSMSAVAKVVGRLSDRST